MCERVLETEQNCNILTPTLVAINVSFPFSRVAQPGAWRPALSGCWFSLPQLFSNWSGLQTNCLPVCTELYNSSTPPFFLWASQIALIQPIHGQGYNSDIPRPDAPVIFIGAFPILTARPGRRSIYNKAFRPDPCVFNQSMTIFKNNSKIWVFSSAEDIAHNSTHLLFRDENYIFQQTVSRFLWSSGNNTFWRIRFRLQKNLRILLNKI